MKTLSLLLSLLLCLPPTFGQETVSARRRAPGGGGSPAVTLSCSSTLSGGNPTHVISGVNDVGAKAIFVAVSSFNAYSGGHGEVSVTHTADASTATNITPFADGNSPSVAYFYWTLPATSSSDSFTVSTTNGTGLYDSTCIFLVSGISGTYSGVNTNNITSGATCTTSSCQAGSITPVGSNQVVMFCFDGYTPSGSPTIDSSITGLQFSAGAGGTAFALACGYLVQTTGAAINPTGTWSNGASTPGAIIAAVH